MNFLPKTLMDKGDLKRTINSLILEDDAQPKAVLANKAPPSKPVVKSQLNLSSQDK